MSIDETYEHLRIPPDMLTQGPRFWADIGPATGGGQKKRQETMQLGEYHAKRIEHDLTPDEQRVVDEFHKLYYRLLHFRGPGSRPEDRDDRDSWLGHRILKNPMDLMTYQEILFDTNPDVIIETGTFQGGSALFLASMCELMGRGRVITINVRAAPGIALPNHPLIDYRIGYSQDPGLAKDIAASIKPHERVMVILDSDHSRDHVLAELSLYSPMVSLGCYVIVEDTNFHLVVAGASLGPREAVEIFLSGTDDFVVDRSREKHLLTFNPGGHLLRVR